MSGREMLAEADLIRAVNVHVRNSPRRLHRVCVCVCRHNFVQQGTQHVIDACVQHGVRALVYTSTYNTVFVGQEMHDCDDLPAAPLELHVDKCDACACACACAVCPCDACAVCCVCPCDVCAVLCVCACVCAPPLTRVCVRAQLQQKQSRGRSDGAARRRHQDTQARQHPVRGV